MAEQKFYDYPSHDVPNEQKDDKWILKFVKAAYKESSANQYGCFHGKRAVYNEVKEHTTGNPPINKFKEQLDVDESDDNSWYKIRWKTLAILPRLRRMALSNLSKRRVYVNMSSVDPRIREEDERHLRVIQNKIKLKQAVGKLDPEAAELPTLQAEEGEPKDMYEFETYKSFGYKHNLVEAFERSNNMIFSDNNYAEEVRDEIDASLMDYGCVALKQDLDEVGRVKLRICEAPNVVTSYFRAANGQDARFIGEYIPLTFSDIRVRSGNKFSSTQLKDIVKKFAGKKGNPAETPDIFPQSGTNISNYDSYRIPVFDLEFKTTMNIDYETREDKRGNKVTRLYKGKEEEKKKKNNYERTTYVAIFKAKWIIGTEYIYDCGPKTNMTRAQNELHDTEYSYKIQVSNLYDMTVVSKMEECITPDEQAQIAWFKMQNEIASAVPNGWFIDFDSLENITFGEGAGATKWNEKVLLDMFFKRGVLVGRRKTINGKIDPNKPVEPISNDSLSGVVQYYDAIQKNIQLIRQTLGTNEYVDGSSVDSKTLKNVTELAQESMNNSLHDIVTAERRIIHNMSKENVLKIQDLIDRGDLHPSYEKALGEKTIELMEAVDDLSSFMMQIEIEPVPSDLERQRLLERLSQFSTTGLIDPSDEFLIMSAKSTKAAWSALDTRIRQRKEEQRQDALALSKANAEANAQAGQAVEQSKQQTLQIEGQIKEAVERMKKEFDVQIAEIKGQYASHSASIRSSKD